MEIYSIYRIVLEISHLFSFYVHTILSTFEGAKTNRKFTNFKFKNTLVSLFFVAH